MVETKPKALKRRRWLRWLGRLLLIALVMGSALLFYGWRERVLLLNTVLLRVGGDFRVQIETLEWQDRVMRVTGAAVMHAPTAHRIANVAEMEWQPVLRDLRGKNLGRVKLGDAEIDVPLSLFSSLGAGDGGGEAMPWRVDAIELGSTRFTVHDEAGKVVVSGQLSGQLSDGTKIDVEASDLDWQGHRVVRRMTSRADLQDGKITLHEARIEGCRVDLAWLPLPVPLRGGFDLEWQGRGLVISGGGLLAGGTHELRLKNVAIGPESGPGRISAAAVDLDLVQEDGLWRLQEGLVSKPEIEWTRELEDVLLPKADPSDGSPAQWKAQVDRLVVQDGRVDLAATKVVPVTG